MNRTMIALLAATGLLLGACGGDDGSSDDSTGTTAAAAAETTDSSAASAAESSTTESSTTEAATASTAAATTAASTGATTATSAATAAGPVAVTLKEWSLAAPATLQAGSVTFDVANGGEFPHEFAVMKGTYETLAKTDIGAVIETELPAGTVIDRTDRIESGSNATLTVDLAAGQYVLLCNIAVGPNSHAGKGQVLNITVS